MHLHLTPALAGTISDLICLAESVNQHLSPAQAALSQELDRARATAPPPDSPTGQLYTLIDAARALDDDTPWWIAFRHCLIGLPGEIPPEDMPAEEAARIITLLGMIPAEELTFLALSQSLCPLHFTDYANCFDDDTRSCRTIRRIHPSHDT
jgi:hypothetical protein